MADEIKEIIDAYKAGHNPPSVQKWIDEHPEEVAHTKEVSEAYKRGKTPSSVLKQLIRDDMHDTLAEDKEKILKILLRYVYEVSEYPGNESSPYWIIFHGFEGENGDLSKEEYELLMKYKGKLWD